jgi:asparagine synthase (glutamine-hydrolysing)
MCGFAGVIGPRARAGLDDVAAMARELEHRGPDDFGVWQGDFGVRDTAYGVALGHTRLSIQDLSPRGHQPMLSNDNALAVAYNGEIYNFRELRAELEQLGSRFRSGTDTEVLLEAYRAWGTDAFDRFVGMFAFALWDARNETLLLVRDRLGIKPLYYGWSDGVLTFGSEIRALRRHRGFRPEIDRVGLGNYLRFGYTCGEPTIYRYVRRLPPANFLTWHAGRFRTEAFWQLSEADPEPFQGSFEQAVDELEQRLGDAIECRLIADVPLGAFLSGGIDSSAVVALMRERARGQVRTFSIGFEASEYDEAPHSRSVAKHLGTEHTELYLRRAEAIEVARALPDLYDEPFADPSAIPTTLLSRLTREHVTVSLSGDGGDELFGGYERYRRFHQLSPLLSLPGGLRRGLAGLAPLCPIAPLRSGLRHLRHDQPEEIAENLTTHFEPELLGPALPGADLGTREFFREGYRSAPWQDPVKRLMFADARTYLPDDILAKVDRASMSVALEARVPILDHRVVRHALSLPRQLLWQNGQTKAPLRALLYRHVPRRLIERPKQGFGIPIHELLARELGEWTQRYLCPERISEEGIFDAASFPRLLGTSARSDALAAERLWILLCFARWFARHHRGEEL